MAKASKGHCLCGAVRITASELGSFGICHCGLCRRWTGGPMMGVHVDEAKLTIEGAEAVVSRRTSQWASRSHCGTCGSPLWFRYDKGVDGAGDYEIPIGLLDDASGLELKRELFIEAKPDSYAIAGDHKRMTEAELMQSLGLSEEGS